MALTKGDLTEIKKIVDNSAKRTEIYLEDRMDFLIEKSEQRTEVKTRKIVNEVVNEVVGEAEDRILKRLDREIDDTSENGRENIARIDNHEKRIVRLEKKLA